MIKLVSNSNRCLADALYPISTSHVKKAEARTNILGSCGVFEPFIPTSHIGLGWDVQVRGNVVYR